MEISPWQCYIVISCALIIPYLVAKPFSLNEAIAAESRQKQSDVTLRPKLTETTAKRLSPEKALRPVSSKSKRIKVKGSVSKSFSLNDAIAAESQQQQRLESTPRPKLTETTAERLSFNKAYNSRPVSWKSKKVKTTGNSLPRGKKVSSLKYKKTFQITSPLKPKKLKYKQKPRHKRKNQSLKRETGNESFNKKYIPLLRSLSLLFDNLLTENSNESIEINRSEDKSSGYISEDRRPGVVCACTRQSNSEVAESKPTKETVTQAPPEISTTGSVESETTATTTDNTPSSNISSIGSNPDVPLLPARNTSSGRRDVNGLGERSGPAFHRSIEGNITRDHRNSEHNTGSEQGHSSSTDNEEDPYSASRDSSSSNEQQGSRRYGDDGGGIRDGGRIRGNESDSQSPIYRGTIEETNELAEDENTDKHIRGNNNEFKGENKLETGGNQTKGATFLPEFIRGFREFIPKDKINNNTESVQSKENHEKSIDYVAYDIASDKRFADRNRTFAAKDQKAGGANETVITIKDLSNPILVVRGSDKSKAPMVTIIDGYSVARDINGQNKLTEKSIHFHS